ncbi:kinase-like protein [Rhizophagus irregularis]|uniref:Kinase-like protein n=1 Tax=Rhizophagus irregularis TaxID=588596 RepID=A0A2N0R738_9GLOM|nr:kinase-like protein [Rhizophagus irregularis]
MKEPSQNQTKIDNIFQIRPLKLADYERDDNEKSRKNGRVTKWYKTTNKGAEFAFKTISENEDRKIVQNQITILKELHDWQNIIKFYGLISDGDQWYLVTEWAECGNLREFYQNKHDFDLKLKLRISLDIARGLNFLRTVEIMHHDIRAENILITLNETAKLANFRLSRYLTAATLNLSQNLDRIRYCAPELLERAPNYKYDQRCEVYSFGILLWEIAEERIPYHDTDDILEIINKVRNELYRDPFSENSQMPEEFKQLQIDGM